MATKRTTKPRSRTKTPARVRPTLAQIKELEEKLVAAEALADALEGQLQPDSRLPHRYTDEGIAEHDAEVLSSGKAAKGGRISVRDGVDLQIDARQAACDDKIPDWEAPDPLSESAALHARPGMRQRFLSDRVIKRRGKRHWEPVKDEKGDLVKVGDVFLAEMPEERAAATRRHYQDESTLLVKDIQESHDEKVRKVSADAKNLGLRVLTPGEVVSDASFPDQKTAIGVSVTRGAAPREVPTSA